MSFEWLKPVSKKARITQAQADAAVRAHMDAPIHGDAVMPNADTSAQPHGATDQTPRVQYLLTRLDQATKLQSAVNLQRDTAERQLRDMTREMGRWKKRATAAEAALKSMGHKT